MSDGSKSPEPMDEDDTVQDSFSPAALGLHRVGTELPRRKAASRPPLNARGMPARIRKKNPLFYEDEEGGGGGGESGQGDGDNIEHSPTSGGVHRKLGKSPMKGASGVGGIGSMSPAGGRSAAKRKKIYRHSEDDDYEEDHEVQSESVSKSDRLASQQLGARLRNLLKLPKAHKFVSYEWFYSNLDRAIFGEENDFQVCLRESFPKLSARMMSRVEWTRIRRIMGKPRRCSQAFFDEERGELERKRQKIRLLQSRKIADVSFVKDLPKEIPLPFALGTKVTARLRVPQDGLFSGMIAAVDPITHKYRVTFPRAGLGTHAVPDFELMAITENETIPLRSITQNFRKKRMQSQLYASPLTMSMSQKGAGDPILGADSAMTAGEASDELLLMKGAGGGGGAAAAAAGGYYEGVDNDSKITIAGHPFILIELILRVKKLLAAKQMKLKRLQQMNSDVAINKSYDEPISDEDQRQYANLVIHLEKINREVQVNLTEIQSYSKYLARDHTMASMLQPSYLREKCKEMGEESVQKYNVYAMTDTRVLGLIQRLGTIMWVTSHLGNNEQYSHVLRVLEGCVEEAKSLLAPENIDGFNKNVMVHIHHIKLGISQMQLDHHQPLLASAASDTHEDDQHLPTHLRHNHQQLQQQQQQQQDAAEVTVMIEETEGDVDEENVVEFGMVKFE